MDTIRNDIFHAIRMFLRRPAFTIVALLTISLGIGINTAIFSIVNGVLLRPLPFPDQEKLTAVFTVLRGGDLDIFSPANFLDVQSQNTTFDSMAALTMGPFDISTVGEPQALPGAQVTADFFRVLGVQPELGRTFSANDDIPGNDRVVVISNSLWKERFGGRLNVMGQQITVNGAPHSVIGVLPAGSEYPENARIWSPIAFTEDEKGRGNVFLDAIGRLKPDVSLETARQELNAIAKRLENEYPQMNRGVGMTAMPLLDAMVGDVRRTLLVLACAVGFVLLIACGNLANLLVASASTRVREFAVRSALGASRKRLLRQLLTESLMLSVSGGLLGAAFAFWSLPAMRALSPAQLPRIAEIAMDWRVLFFTILVSIVTGILFGLAPAFGFSRPDLQSSLKDGTRTASAPQSRRLGNVLIVLEVSIVLVLLTGAGLMVRSFKKLNSVHPGFEADNLVSFQLTLPELQYPERANRVTFSTQLFERLRAIPGTESVAIASTLPFSGQPEVNDVVFSIEGLPQPSAGEYPVADLTRVTPEYFKTMNIPLIKGRTFDINDREDSPKVMIVSATLAKAFFPDQNPIGRKVLLGRRSPIAFEIVGVAGDVKHISLNAAIRPELYLAYSQLPTPLFSVVVKTSDPTKLLANAKTQVWSVNPNLPLRFLSSVDKHVARSTAPARASMLMISVFAGMALLLAIVGLYGLIAYSVSQRTREMGIRVALGAQQQSIVRLVLQKGMFLTLIGTGIGVIGSLAVTRFLSALLFQVSPTDAGVFVTVSLILIGTAGIACYIPARRASRIDPIRALRYE